MENMEEFKQDKISKYFDERINEIKNDSKLDELGKKRFELYYLKREQEVREAQKMYLEGTKILLENIINNNIKTIDLNKSKFINYTIDIINAIQNNASDNEIQWIINHYTGLGIGLAKMMVESIILSFTNPLGMINIIEKKFNLNEKSTEELEKLCNMIEYAKQRLEEKIKTNAEDDEFEYFIKLMKCYSIICKNSVKDEIKELSSETNGLSRTKEKNN